MPFEIELDGTRAKVRVSDYELSLEEWYRRRKEAFAEVRKFGGIPDELLDLVEHFRERAIVQPLFCRPTEKLEFRFGVKVEGSQQDGDETPRCTEKTTVRKRMQDGDQKQGMTASEALAFFLRIFLGELKYAEKNRKAAPVRTLKLIPRSLIAEIAMDLLGSCKTWGYPPGGSLNDLIRELLNLDHDRQSMSRDVETQERAVGIVALAPNVRTRELARALHVDASTISRWRRSPEFKEMVERKKEKMKADGGLSESIDTSGQGELTQEELSRFLSGIVEPLSR